MGGDKSRKIAVSTVMAPRPGQGNVAQRRCAEGVIIGRNPRHPEPAFVARMGFKSRGFAGAELRHRHRMKPEIAQQGARVARGASGSAVKQISPGLRHWLKLDFAAQGLVKRGAVRSPFLFHKGGNGIGYIGKRNIVGGSDRRINGRKHFSISRDFGNPPCDQIPGTALICQLAQTYSLGHIAFGIVPCHFVTAEDGKHRLGRYEAGKAFDHFVIQRGAKPAGAIRRGFDPAIIKQRAISDETKIEQRLCVAWNAGLGRIVYIRHPFGAQSDTAIANGQRNPVAGAKGRVVTRGAGDLFVAGQDRIIKQQPSQRGLGRSHGRKVPIVQRLRQIRRGGSGGKTHQQAENDLHV